MSCDLISPLVNIFKNNISKILLEVQKINQNQKFIKIQDFLLITNNQPYSQVVDEDIRRPDVHGGHPDLLHAPVLGTVPPQVLVHPTL